jgi:type IV pilus biogenesis protein CpaD/CtpE
MTRRALTLSSLAVLVAVLLAGCGISDPYTQPPQAKIPAAAPPMASDSQPSGSSRQVVEGFTQAWVNWSAATLPTQRHLLAALATGGLAGELRRDAAQALRTQLEQDSGAYSHGHLIGIIREGGGRLVLVTYEVSAPVGGAAQSGYHVYLARTQQTDQGWRVSEWQPASDT